jgi:hypothetical protein
VGLVFVFFIYLFKFARLSFGVAYNVPTLCVRAGFRSTKLSTYH